MKKMRYTNKCIYYLTVTAICTDVNEVGGQGREDGCAQTRTTGGQTCSQAAVLVVVQATQHMRWHVAKAKTQTWNGK